MRGIDIHHFIQRVGVPQILYMYLFPISMASDPICILVLKVMTLYETLEWEWAKAEISAMNNLSVLPN